MPLFSILIVVYKGDLNIIEKNLQNLNFEDYEVIIVDNSESDAYFNKLNQWASNLLLQTQKKITLIQAPFNGGYTKGNNIAFTKSSGKYLLVLNPDMELGTNFLRKANHILERKTWKIIFPKIFYTFESKKIQSTFFIFRKDSVLNPFIPVGMHQVDTGLFDAYYESYYAPGGCFIISRDLFKKLHGFDENYFMYAEETDLCFQAKQLNEKIVFCPQLTAAHLREGDSPFALGQMLQNNLVFFGKYFSFLFLAIQFLFSFIRSIFQTFDKQRMTNEQNSFRIELFIVFLKSTCNGFVRGWKHHLLKNI